MENKNYTITVKTPLGDDELLFQSMSGTEEMGRLFEFEVELVRIQSKGTVDVSRLLGESMTIELDMPESTNRYFNGMITQFKHTGFVEGLYCYRAILRPSFWLLTRTADCRVFQEKKIPDIIKDILNEVGDIDFEMKTSATYEPLDYCVQYRESDFDFISRLMEHAGIFYYFKHVDNKHTMVITDDGGNYQSIGNYEEIPYFPPSDTESRERDHIYYWLKEHQIQSGQYELNDYDFEAPTSDLTTKSKLNGGHKNDNFEIYDYPGKYTKTSEGTPRTTVRSDELHSRYALVKGQGNALGITTGMEFKLKDFYFKEENGVKHVIVSASYMIQGGFFGSGGGNGSAFDVSFVALESKQQFRPQRITPKPVISGAQTAKVVGKQGEEIWTDKYGRVKVQFHWDREGKDDEKSSLWIRVSSTSAGKKWGWISIPRIGQEVVVSFLEGDPDQPLITGLVYNADHMPPYTLPDNQTQSGIKTHSSKSGSADNFNEIRFEDKKGEEELYIHAEKDCNRVVENNDTLKVGFDKKDKGDQTIEIYNDRTTTLEQGNETLTVKKGKRTTEIQGDDKLTLKQGNHSIDVKAGKITVKAAVSIELKVGSNSIKIDQSGITIKGTMVKIQGSATAEMKSPMTTVKGDGMLTLKGGMTMIN